MNLRKVLTDKLAINALKEVYDAEITNKEGYHSRIDALSRKYPNSKELMESVELLKDAGLLFVENSEDGLIVSVSEKGKQFIEIFDKLVALSRDQNSSDEQKKFKIKYELGESEKKTLVVVYRLIKENGQLLLNDLVQELYPHDKISYKRPTVSKTLIGLKDMNLIDMNDDGVGLTASGERVVQRQLLERLV